MVGKKTMNGRLHHQLATALACACAMLASPAVAEFRWEFNYASSGNCLGSGGAACSFGNTRNASSVTDVGTPGPGPVPSTTSITAQAWADTGTDLTPTARTLATAYLPGFGSNGMGVQNRDMDNQPSPPPSGLAGGGDAVERDSPEHSMDNSDRFDAMLFRFADPNGVRLTGLEIGWQQTDSDMSVLAYDPTAGVDNPSPGTLPLSGLNYSDLLTSGWKLVGNFATVPEDVKFGISTTITANYFLIGSYNPDLGGCTGCGTGHVDQMKLLALYAKPGTTTQVPEPGALLLLGVALAGAWGTRRRKLT
jgi:hypothetical protein